MRSLLLLPLCLLALPPRAWADSSTHLQAGLEHLGEGRMAEAVVELQVARALGADGEAAWYLGTALMKRGRAEEALELFHAATREAPAARDALLGHAQLLACNQARLYRCALRLLSSPEEGLSPRLVAQREKLRAELTALFRDEPKTASLDWYHHRATEALAAGRPVLAAAYADEALALAGLRADRYRLDEAARTLARARREAEGSTRRTRRPVSEPLRFSGGADPCAPPPQPHTQAPQVASAYLAAGEAERVAGDGGASAFAYREALRHGAPPTRVRAALSGLCTQAREPGVLAEGLARMERGDLRGAIASFSAVRARAASPSAALLQGICHYELGEDAQARPLLLEARGDTDVADSANLYLGLLAFRAGAHAEAATHFQAAAAVGDPALARTARDMERLTRSDGKLVLVASAESGYDSNLTLSPGSLALQGSSADGGGTLSLIALVRPFGASGPYARAEGSYRKQLRFGLFDTGGAAASVGWRLGGGARHARVEYGYEGLTVGGTPYLGAHRVSVSGRLPLGALALDASYSGRYGQFLREDVRGYSGLRHTGEGGFSLRLGTDAWLGATYRLTRDLAISPALAHFEQGPRAELGLRLGEPVELSVRGGVLWRAFDAVDAAFGVERQEQVLEVGVALDVALSDHWSARAFVGGQQARSTVARLNFQQLVGSFGLSYVLSAL